MKLRFTLYVSGRTGRTERAVANLRQLLDSRPGVEYELSVCDVREEPQKAEEDKVLATPTLIRECPLPVVRMIGDISDPQKVVSNLRLPSGEIAEWGPIHS